MIVNFDKLYLNFYLIVINIYFFTFACTFNKKSAKILKGKNNRRQDRLKQVFNLFVNLRNHKIYSYNNQRDI